MWELYAFAIVVVAALSVVGLYLWHSIGRLYAAVRNGLQTARLQRRGKA
jgi:hypothetical protein